MPEMQRDGRVVRIFVRQLLVDDRVVGGNLCFDDAFCILKQTNKQTIHEIIRELFLECDIASCLQYTFYSYTCFLMYRSIILCT